MNTEEFEVTELAQIYVAMNNRVKELAWRIDLLESWGDNVRLEICKKKIKSCRLVLEKLERLR